MKTVDSAGGECEDLRVSSHDQPSSEGVPLTRVEVSGSWLVITAHANPVVRLDASFLDRIVTTDGRLVIDGELQAALGLLVMAASERTIGSEIELLAKRIAGYEARAEIVRR